MTRHAVSRPATWRSLCALVLLGAVVAVVAACSRGADDEHLAATGERVTGTVTVLAASSLTDVLAPVAAAFEATHDGIDVALTVDGSDRLAIQILEGVSGDVFVSAGTEAVASLEEADRTSGEVVTVATNQLQIAVAVGNPLGVRGLADLGPGRRAPTIALCEASVPCGAYAADAFARAGLPVPPATEEGSVRGVLTKVRLGEVDAGIVYVTDLHGAADVDGIDLPADHQVSAAYPAVVLTGAPNPRAAAAFVAFLTEEEAQAIFARFGFGAP